MLDIKLIREQGESVQNQLNRRGSGTSATLEQLLKLDELRRNQMNHSNVKTQRKNSQQTLVKKKKKDRMLPIQ